MASTNSLRIIISGDASQLNQVLGSVDKKLGRTAGAFKAIGGGAAVGLGFAVKSAMKFEKQLSSLGAVSDASAKQMDQFRKQALKAGADTAFSANEAAVAQTELAKGGLSVANIMGGGLKSALSLAAAGQLELGEAASYTANAMNLFGLKGKDSIQVADALATAANVTTADVSDFGAALVQSGSVAKSAGLSFNQTVTALEALAASGIKNSDAGTSLKTSLIQLIKPTEKQAELADKLGLSFVGANGKFKDMSTVSAMLRDKLGKMGQAQRTATLATLAGTDGVRTLTALYDAGPKKIEAYSAGLAKQGTAAEVARKKQDNLAGALEKLKGAVETIAIQVGSVLIPKLRDGAEALTKFLDRMLEGKGAGGQFASALRRVGSAAGTVVTKIRNLTRAYQDGDTKAVILVGTLATLTSAFVAFRIVSSVTAGLLALKAALAGAAYASIGLSAALTANPIGLVVVAIAALGTAFVVAYRKSETFRKVVDTSFRVIKRAGGEAIAFLLRRFSDLLGAYSSFFSFVGKIPGVGRAFKGLAGGIDAIRGRLDTAADAAEKFADKAKKPINFRVNLNYRDVANGTPLSKAKTSSLAGTTGDIPARVKQLAEAHGRSRAPSIRSMLGGALGGGGGGAKGGKSSTGGLLGGLSPAGRAGMSLVSRMFGGVRLTSGRRSPAQNAAVGGAKNSDHLTGNAIDLVPSEGWTSAGISRFDRIANWARKSGIVRFVGWRGLAGHGPNDHLHLSFLDRGTGGSSVGDPTDLVAFGGKIPGMGDVVRKSDGSPAARIFRFFKGQGFTDGQAAAWVGNFQQESGLDPAIVQPGGEGHGLAQWGGGRFAALQAFAAKRKTPWQNMDTQLAFVMHELRGPEASAFKAIKGAKGTRAAVDAIGSKYERYGIKGNRYGPAQDAYRRFAGGKAGGGGGGSRGGGSRGGGARSVSTRAPVDRAEQQSRAGSRIVNRIAGPAFKDTNPSHSLRRGFVAGSKGITSLSRFAAERDRVTGEKDVEFGQAERRFGQTEEDLGTAKGREKRTSELGELKKLKAAQLKRRQARLGALNQQIVKYDGVIKGLRDKLKSKKVKGATAARIRKRLGDYEDKRLELLAEARSLGSQITDTKLDLGDIDKEIKDVASTADTAGEAADTPAGDTAGERDAAPAAPTATERLADIMGTIDAQERAGDYTAEQARAGKIQNIRMALAGEFGAISDRERLDLRGDLLEANTAAIEANTTALQSSLDLQKEQLAVANRALAISQNETGTIGRAIADIVSGELGGRIGLGLASPGFAGGGSRY